MDSSNNMRFYEAGREVPQEAMKPIEAGRLRGMSDINPVWRIKVLTQMFGPVGIGWWYEIVNKEIVRDELTGTAAAFVDILLYYVEPETGKTSHGIPGTGGSSFVAKERNGPYLSDECFKMALTDALSVACKALGIGADVYFEKDKTKYTDNPGSARGSRRSVQEEAPRDEGPQYGQPLPTISAKDALKLTVQDGDFAGKSLKQLFVEGETHYLDRLFDNQQADPMLRAGIKAIKDWYASKSQAAPAAE